jgi:hypothetical protein
MTGAGCWLMSKTVFLLSGSIPQMALIKSAIEADGLLVSHHLNGSIKIPFIYDTANKM